MPDAGVERALKLSNRASAARTPATMMAGSSDGPFAGGFGGVLVGRGLETLPVHP
jgi:hypothetical protein